MREKVITICVYFGSALAGTCSWTVQLQREYFLSPQPWYYALLPIAAVLFIFAYARAFLTETPSPRRLWTVTAPLHLLAAAVTLLLFVRLSAMARDRPFRSSDSVFWTFGPFVALVILFAVSIFLLCRRKSTLAPLAAVLFWPYLLFIVLTFDSGHFGSKESQFFAFLCPYFLAFAAGAAWRRPRLAHISAFAGLAAALPWIYHTHLQNQIYGNDWNQFNMPDREIRMVGGLRPAELTILTILVLVTALMMSILRMLPAKWTMRGSPLRERTWPAFVATFVFLAIWFADSVMPYRVFGAVTPSDWPTFQILHVEKRGLRFHQTCVSVYNLRRRPALAISWGDRRLFQYHFDEFAARAELSDVLAQRVAAAMQPVSPLADDWGHAGPLRKWNEDGWYVRGEKIGLRAYVSAKGETPPPEVVSLFEDLATLPHSDELHWDQRDVCLGFCYDPLAGLGYVSANFRCHYDQKTLNVVCF